MNSGRKRVLKHFQKYGTSVVAMATQPLPTRVPHLSEIEKLGLGPEVVRLRQQGYTAVDIGKELGVSKWKVLHYIRQWNEMNPAQRLGLMSRSIFDIAQRLEETVEDLHMMKLEAQGMGDSDIPNTDSQIKIAKLELEAMKMAESLTSRLELLKKKDKFQEVVLDCLEEEAPGIKAKALKRLSSEIEGISALRGL